MRHMRRKNWPWLLVMMLAATAIFTVPVWVALLVNHNQRVAQQQWDAAVLNSQPLPNLCFEIIKQSTVTVFDASNGQQVATWRADPGSTVCPFAFGTEEGDVFVMKKGKSVERVGLVGVTYEVTQP